MRSDDSMPEMSLCVRLRLERERRQIPLSSICANTKISATLFEGLERGDVSRWPSGIFRRSFIRAYASAIGLDPDSVAREFLAEFPDPFAPAPAPLPVPAPRASPGVFPAPSPPPPAASSPAAAAASPAHADASGLRLKLADTPRPFIAGRLLGGMRQRLAAVGCDAGVIAVIALSVFIISDKFWLPLGVAMIGYYLGGILLLGNTPGVCLLAPGDAGGAHYNQPRDDDSQSEDDRQTAHPDWHLRVPAR